MPCLMAKMNCMKKTFALLAFIGICTVAINSNAQSASGTTDTEKSAHRDKEHHDKEHHNGKGHHKDIHLFHHRHQHHGRHGHHDHGGKGNHDKGDSKDKQRSSKK